jgi:hypothetical protein
VQEGGDVEFGPCGKKPAILPHGLKPPGEVPTLMREGRTAGLGGTDADGASQVGASELAGDAMSWTVCPLVGNTTDWRAGCGRSARPVRREGVSKPIDAPYPYQSSVKNSARRLRACPLALVERTIRNRSENGSESNGRSPLVSKLAEESDTFGNLQEICRIPCKTLQILPSNLGRFASPLNSLGILHGRRNRKPIRRVKL